MKWFMFETENVSFIFETKGMLYYDNEYWKYIITSYDDRVRKEYKLERMMNEYVRMSMSV